MSSANGIKAYMKFSSIFRKTQLAIVCTIALTACGDNTGDLQQQTQQHLKQASAYTQQGQYRAAMIEAKNAIQKTPDDINAHIALANILITMGLNQQAASQLEQVADKGQDSADYLATLAKAYVGYGKFHSAEKVLSNLDIASSTKLELLQGKALMGIGQIDKAITQYKAVQQKDPTNIDAQLGLATAYASKNEFHKTFEILDVLKSQSTGNPEVTLFEASLAIRDGDLDKTEELLTQALSELPAADVMTPLKANILKALADVLTKQGRSSEALVYTKILADAFPGADIAESKFKEALELSKENKLDEAKSALSQLLDEYPGYQQASQLLAMINYLQGNFEEASQYFGEQFDPELSSETITTVAAMNSLRLNDPTRVVDLLEDQITTTENPDILALYGLAALGTGDTGNKSKGESALLKAIQLKPENTRLSIALAQFYNGENPPRRDDALVRLLSAHDKNKDDTFVTEALARQYLLVNKPEDAQRVVAEAVAQSPKDIKAQLLAGGFFAGQRNFKQSLPYFSKATQIDSESMAAWLGKAASEIGNKQYDDARASLNKAIEINPEVPNSYKGLIVLASLENNVTQELEILASTAKNSPSTTPALVLSEYFATQNDFASAREWAGVAKRINSEEPKIGHLLAFISFKEAALALIQKDWDSARSAALEGLKYAPGDTRLLSALADSELRAGDLSEAEKLATQINATNPGLADHIRGDIAAKKDDPDSALKLYKASWTYKPTETLGRKIYGLQSMKDQSGANAFVDQWLLALPNSRFAQVAKSSELIAKENYASAISLLEKLVQQQPNFAPHWNNLAWSYLQTQNPQAEAAARNAAALAPEDPAVLDTLGWILYKKGKTSEAVTILEKAAELGPDIEEIQQHLGLARKG